MSCGIWQKEETYETIVKEPATTLRSLGPNINPEMIIRATDPFYVHIDYARNSNPKEIPVRVNMKIILEDFYDDNTSIFNETETLKDLSYAQLLLVGHRACGKSTELQILCDEITDMYESILIHNIASSEDDFSNDKEFLYFVARQIVEHCQNHNLLNDVIIERIENRSTQ